MSKVDTFVTEAYKLVFINTAAISINHVNTYFVTPLPYGKLHSGLSQILPFFPFQDMKNINILRKAFCISGKTEKKCGCLSKAEDVIDLCRAIGWGNTFFGGKKRFSPAISHSIIYEIIGRCVKRER